MKIDLNQIDVTDFNMVDCTFGGDACVWIYPHLEGVKWTKDNLILRSSIWRKSDGMLVSAGFKKFFNWTQEPLIYPPPDALTQKINVVEKLDGSCLIISKYNGELIIRTRRALAETMLNGDEIELFKQQYPKIFNFDLLDHGVSLLFEWLTPSNQIVIKYARPTIKLIGAICHDHYVYYNQTALDNMAVEMDVDRPKYFKYKTIEEMLQNTADLKDEEGVCVYYGNDQHIRKIKSDWYLAVHNFRNAMNLKNIVDLYFRYNMPNYNDFCTAVLNQYQYEGLMMARPLISQICDAMKEVNKIVDSMRTFVDTMKANPSAFPNRKMMAEHILSSYGQTSRSGIVFNILDNKQLGETELKKLLFQVLATS